MIAPIEFSPLRQSAFNVVFRNGSKLVGRTGFTAKYAGHVHEMPMKNKGKPRTGKSPEGKQRKGSFWESGENKFLEKAVHRNMSVIRKILKNRLKR